MATFTIDNTEGQFTTAELGILNEALALLKARNPDAEEYTLSDAVSNAWVGGQTAEQLADATGF